MIRDYTNKASTDAVKFFTGIEVEKTKYPANLLTKPLKKTDYKTI